jgi:TP901 family phage tail tape measure protein
MSNKLTLMVNFLGGDKLSGAIRNIIGTGKTARQVLKDMAREATGLERELGKVRREIAGASGNITDLVSRERALERQIEQTNAEMARRRRLMEIDANADQIRARGQEIMDRGRDNMAEGAVAAAPLVLMGRAAMQNEKALALMAQKLDLNDRQTIALGNSLQRAALQAKQLPENIIAGADFLAGKGLGSKELEAMMPVVGRFATAWDADVVDSVKAAHANFLSLKVPLDQTAQALEIMAVAGKEGGFEVRDMAAQFPVLTSNLAKFGSTGLTAVADLSAALQVLEAKTGDGATAANNLDNMLSFALSGEGIKKFSKAGIDIVASLKQAARDGKSPIETIARLTKQATGGDDMRISEIFSDKQARDGVTALIQSEEQYRQIRDAAMNARGMTAKEFDRMSKVSSANMTVLTGSLQGLAVTLGTHLLPILVTGTQWLTGIITSIGEWAQANPAAASTIMTVITALVGMKIAVGALQFALGGLFGPIATIYKAWSKLFPAGLLASRAFGMVVKGGMAFGRVMLFVGRAMLMNPIGLLVTAIGVAAYLIYTHWDKIKGAFSAGIAYLGQAWAWLKGNARNILQLSGPIGQAALFIWDNWATIKTAFAQGLAFVSGLVGRFLSVGRAIIDGLVSGITAAPGRIWAALKRIIGGAWQNAKEFLGIASPSRLFATMGGHISSGLAMGIDRGRRQPLGSMKRLAAGVAAAGAMSLSPSYAAAPRGGVAVSGQAVQAQAGAVTINVYGAPGQDVKALADEVMRRLEAAKAVRGRSSFDDDE